MIRLSPILLGAMCACCTVTVKPLPKSQPARAHNRPHRAVTYSNKRTVQTKWVSADWLDKYSEMEKQHGNYKIPQDHEIISDSTGFRVPIEVVHHYEDLLHASQLTPSPAP